MAEDAHTAGGLLLLHNALEQQTSHKRCQRLQQQQPSLPPRPQEAAAAPPAGAAAGDPVGDADKAAALRTKNRLAQQRFRERQRLKEREADEQCSALQREIDEVAAERGRLQSRGVVLCKVLAVRDAMLHTFATLRLDSQAEEEAQHAPGEPALAAAQGFAAALRELDAGAAPAAQQAAPASSTSQPAAPEAAQGRQAAGRPQPGARARQWALGEPHRSGVASHLDGSALREVESIPPASDAAVVAMLEAWTDPDQLVDFFREWQADLKARYDAARQAGFDAASVAEVEAAQDRMTLVWWHVGQLKPAYLCYLAHAALPENSGQLPLWREIAADVMRLMDERSVAIVRQSWLKYSKRMARIAVGVSRWVERLQQYAVQPAGGLVTNAQRALELTEIVGHMAAAVQDEYIASMEFVATQFPASTSLTKAYVNYRSAPYLPDLVAIVSAIVQLDSERRPRGEPGGASAGACTGNAGAEPL